MRNLLIIGVILSFAVMVHSYDVYQGNETLPEVAVKLYDSDAKLVAGLTTEWIGQPVMAKEGVYSEYPVVMFTDDEVEIGLRSDGMVVWRKAK